MVADDEASKAEITGDEATGRVLVITAEPESTEATVQPESDVSVKKPAVKCKRKKGVTTKDSADK